MTNGTELTHGFAYRRGVKKNLWICVILLVVASFCLRSRQQPAQEGFTIDGVGLGWPDERVEALVGRELPNSDCGEQQAHLHHYAEGLTVLFNDTTFRAECISGRRLELDGRIVLQQGDPVEAVTGPFVSMIPLEGGGRLVARPAPVSFFEAETEFGWKPILTRGLDEGFHVVYRYEDDDGAYTDAFDFDIEIFARRGRVQAVSLRWMGH